MKLQLLLPEERMENTQSHVRLFIAVDMPVPMIEQIDGIQNHFKRAALFKGIYVNPATAHITLKFLGSVSPKMVPEFDRALQTITMVPMTAKTGQLALFEKDNNADVLYLNIICPELAALAHEINRVLESWFSPDQHEFVSHVTIARIKEITNPDLFKAEMAACQIQPLSFIIDHFSLEKSITTPAGSIYTPLSSYSLKKQGKK